MKHLWDYLTDRLTLSIGVGFFILGFLFGNWATLIPYIKYSYDVDDAQLGLLLLCLPLGALSFNTGAAVLVQKFGAAKIAGISMAVICLAYMLPFLAASLWQVAAGLVVVGMCMSTLNVSINICATRTEAERNIHIMATCHGMFSLGLMTGSLMRSITLLLPLTEVTHMAVMACLSLVAAVAAAKNLNIPKKNTTAAEQTGSFKFIWPKGTLLYIILISLCINMTEGSMTDWASLYMKEIVQTSPYFQGWGLFGYSLFMALGRLLGDRIIPAVGKKEVLQAGALLAICGILIIVVLPYTFTAIIGFAFIGMGVSCGAPILYASASRCPDLPDAGGLALMNTFAMTGFLGGPVIIGFISKLTSLPWGMAFVGLLCLFWFYRSKNIVLY